MSNVARMPPRGRETGDSFAEQVKAQIDLAELVGKYTDLKNGGKSQVGICPLPEHQEKTGSFHVYPDGKYKCFGCGGHGDCFQFLQEVENVDFRGALELAAQHAGMPMPEYDAKLSQEQRLQWRILQEVADWYQGSVEYFKDRALGYMEKRGLTDESIKTHRLGYAAMKADNLKPLIERHGLKPFLDLGLMRKSKEGGGHYAFFRDRLIFPVLNSAGNVISFQGRAIEDGAKAKYLTLNTPFFERSNGLYGMHTIKDPTGTVNWGEGPLDVILAVQQLGAQAVAPLGTEVSQDQMNMVLARCSELQVLVDGDAAGRKAAVELARMMLGIIQRAVNIQFVKFPEGEDPGSWLLGKTSLEGLEAKPMDEVLICAARHKFDIDSWHGQALAAEWLSETMPDAYKGPALEVLKHRLAVALGLPMSAFHKEKAVGA